MLITDSRFAAVLVTSTGKLIPFDSIDCLLSYLAEQEGVKLREILVADAGAPSLDLLRADSAVFVRNGALRPPMGRAVALRATGANRARLMNGQALSWAQLHRDGRSGVTHAQ
jgi:hypothetical protein